MRLLFPPAIITKFFTEKIISYYAPKGQKNITGFFAFKQLLSFTNYFFRVHKKFAKKALPTPGYRLKKKTFSVKVEKEKEYKIFYIGGYDYEMGM